MTGTGEGPDNGWSFAAHAAGGYRCGYAPLLADGRLIQSRDPAWQMPEKTRDPGCLTELVRIRAVKPATDRRPGYGLGFFHSHRSLREYPGYPDCHIWGADSIHRELKRMGHTPQPAQATTLTRMRQQAGLDVGVWWPCCWYAGRIDAELAALAGRHDFEDLIGQHWAPGLPPQPAQPGYTPWAPQPAAPTTPAKPARPNRTGRAERLAPRAASPTPRPDLALPGAALPAAFRNDPGEAYVIPMPATARASAACGHLAVWLRVHDFAPWAVPYPVRIVDGPHGVAVQCRFGGPAAPRVWRWAPKQSTLSLRMLDALDAATVPADAAAAMLDDTEPARDQPTTAERRHRA